MSNGTWWWLTLPAPFRYFGPSKNEANYWLLRGAAHTLANHVPIFPARNVPAGVGIFPYREFEKDHKA
ncbi:MAG TPA: hypothetical protein VK604_22150, partial [Bryobacteraceae bacterium]|nr:hypothetical protein [Bryobacteraceae bacterium]